MSVPKFEAIRYEVDGPVATLTLNRPDAANAQSTQMLEELDAALDLADADDAVRVVIVAGEGKHFSAGHDLKEILEGTTEWARMRETAEGSSATSRSCTGTSASDCATSASPPSQPCRAYAPPRD